MKCFYGRFDIFFRSRRTVACFARLIADLMIGIDSPLPGLLFIHYSTRDYTGKKAKSKDFVGKTIDMG